MKENLFSLDTFVQASDHGLATLKFSCPVKYHDEDQPVSVDISTVGDAANPLDMTFELSIEDVRCLASFLSMLIAWWDRP